MECNLQKYWITNLDTWNYDNIINQLDFNKKEKLWRMFLFKYIIIIAQSPQFAKYTLDWRKVPSEFPKSNMHQWSREKPIFCTFTFLFHLIVVTQIKTVEPASSHFDIYNQKIIICNQGRDNISISQQKPCHCWKRQ